MKIERIIPKPKPCDFTMTFPQNEGWAIAAALNYYAKKHPDAASAASWEAWAAELGRKLSATNRSKE